MVGREYAVAHARSVLRIGPVLELGIRGQVCLPGNRNAPRTPRSYLNVCQAERSRFLRSHAQRR